MASRIKIRVGAIEVEYEGEEKFIKDELPGLIKAVAELQEKAAPLLAASAQIAAAAVAQSAPTPRAVDRTMTTSTIAAKLKVHSGSDLVLAACAHLGITEGKSEFSRNEIGDAMRSATVFYKKSYQNNFSNYLSTLVKSGQLNELATDKYALTANTVEQLNARLGT